MIKIKKNEIYIMLGISMILLIIIFVLYLSSCTPFAIKLDDDPSDGDLGITMIRDGIEYEFKAEFGGEGLELEYTKENEDENE